MATSGGSEGPEFEVHVAGHPKSGGVEGREGQLAACPFSLRVLLLLEERAVPYTPNYVDLQQKPAWVSEVGPEGSLPILKDLDSGLLLPDSSAISEYLEDKYRGAEGKRQLGKLADYPQPAAAIWPKFIAFLKAQAGEEEEAARQELEQQLQEAEAAVPNERPYMGGQDVCSWDLALAPRLFLARQGCKLLKGWDWGEQYDNLKAYLHRMTGRPSWRNAASWDDDCIAADLRRKMPA